MQPVLLTQTIFANRYFLLHQPDSLVISDGQVWVVRDYQANCQVLLWTFPTVNSRQAGVFKSNLASYQQVDSPGLLPLLDYGVSADDIPYLVTDDWVVTTGLTHPVIADDEQLASLLKQLTETVLALHQQSLSPTRLDAETIIVNEIQNQYQLLPLIKPIDKRADLANLIALSETLSPDSPATKWLKEQTNERDLTVEQINQVTNQYYISKEWKLPEVPKPEVVAEPTDTESTSEPVKTEPSGGTTGDYSNKNKWLMGVGISVALLLIILLIAQNWPKKRVEIQTGSTKLDRTLKDTSTTKGENLPPSPLPNFSEQYRSLLTEGQKFVKNDRHQDALNSFNKAVALQQQYRLPEDRVVRKLSKDYQNLGDERFRVNIRPPVMRDMMDIPLKYYQLAEALHSTPYLKKKIEECKRLQRP